MKVKGAKQIHYDAGPNMTPLVDVVMVILIFLMLAGKFGGEEHYLASTVPVRKGAPGKVTDAIPKDVEFRITVDSLGDRFSARVDGVDDPVTNVDDLKKILASRLDQFVSIGKQPNDIQVLISPGRTVKYNYLIQVYEAALAASPDDKTFFTKVAFEPSH